MTAQDNEKLQQIFRAIFKLDAASDLDSVRPNETPQWDSLGHVMLIAALESEFNLSLDVADAMRITSFELARQVLQEHGI